MIVVSGEMIGLGSGNGPGEKVLRGELCPPTSARGLYWNWTQVGDLSAQPCPGGATGLAHWRCVMGSDPAQPPHRHPASPDLSECRSVWLTNLDSRITEGDTIISIANDLCSVSDLMLFSSKINFAKILCDLCKVWVLFSSKIPSNLYSITNNIHIHLLNLN